MTKLATILFFVLLASMLLSIGVSGFFFASSIGGLLLAGGFVAGGIVTLVQTKWLAQESKIIS